MIRYPFEAPPAPGEAVEVAEGILWLRLPLPMALDHVNVHALRDGDGWTLIDTGLDTRMSRAVWDKVLSGPLGGVPVTRVIATHHHLDHVGLAGWFVERGAELVTTRTAFLYARMLVLDDQATHHPDTLAHYRSGGMAPEVFDGIAGERPFNFSDAVAPLPLGFTRIRQGDVLSFGGRTWDVRRGDGHAPDHATFWCRDEPLILGGDQLLPSISPNIGVYATEPGADPLGEWLDTCERFAPHATAEQLVLPGHKRPYTGLPDRLRQMIGNHAGALDRLRDHLCVPRTAADCFPVLYMREIDRGTYVLALNEALAHLNHLLSRGEVVRERRSDGAWLWTRKE